MGGALSFLAPVVGSFVYRLFAGRPSNPAPMPANLFQQPPPSTPSAPPPPRVKSPKELREEARKVMGIDCVNCYNFGVAGMSGVGKSSLINALLGIGNGGQGAAKVGVTETTGAITSYPHPEKPHVVLWDIPGGGTLLHKVETYFLDKKLYAFDMLLIVTAGRFTDLDHAIATAARKYDVPIAFIRTKSDQDIDNMSLDLGKPKREAKLGVKTAIVNDIKGQLPNELKDREVFVISSRVMGPPIEDFDPEVYALDEERMTEYISQVALERRGGR